MEINYLTMRLKNPEELNKIYNFQDTIILCKIFEQRSEHLQKLFKYNLRKCNSASPLSGCVHRDKSKCLIALPTDAEHIRVFEKTKILTNDKINKKVFFHLEIDGKKKQKEFQQKS